MKDYFSYNVGTDIVKPTDFRISASQISRFFDSTSQWYREFLLGEDGFSGSTASELGKCVHAAAAMQIDTGTVNYDAIYKYVTSIKNENVDKYIVHEQYQQMIPTIVDYIQNTRFTESESFLWQEILPGIGVGGSCDAYDSHLGIVTDFKSTSAKSPPKSFSRAYWFQLMVYAYLYKKQGKPVNYIKLVYVTRAEVNRVSEKTGKPLKDYPSVIYTLQEEVTQENLNLIESCIHLIAESVQTWQQHPELRYLLAQDYRLKQKQSKAAALFS